MTLELPWPPSANNLHAVVRGRKILSRKGREYRLTLYLPDNGRDASEGAAGDA